MATQGMGDKSLRGATAPCYSLVQCSFNSEKVPFGALSVPLTSRPYAQSVRLWYLLHALPASRLPWALFFQTLVPGKMETSSEWASDPLCWLCSEMTFHGLCPPPTQLLSCIWLTADTLLAPLSWAAKTRGSSLPSTSPPSLPVPWPDFSLSLCKAVSSSPSALA